MSEFSLLCTDSALWDLATSAMWGSLDFCPEVMPFWIHTITQGQLTALSQVGSWGDVEKPYQDMVFLLIAPSLAVRCEQVFGLTAMSTQPCQVHLPTLVDAAQKLLLLTDKGVDWPYTIRMNNAVAHMPLSSEGHTGSMTSDVPSWNAHGHLHQLCVWQLLQCESWVVCPDGQNGGLEPLMFDFKELPLWNTANVGELCRDPSLIDVDLDDVLYAASPSIQVEDLLSLSSRGTLEQPSLASLATPHSPSQYLTSRMQTPSAVLRVAPLTERSLQSVRAELMTPTLAITPLHLQGVFEQLQQTSPTVPVPIFWHSMPKGKPTSVVLGAPPSTRAEDPLGLEGMDSAASDTMATSSQASPGKAMPEHAPNTVWVSNTPSPPVASKTPDMASISLCAWSPFPPRASPTGLPDEVL